MCILKSPGILMHLSNKVCHPVRSSGFTLCRPAFAWALWLTTLYGCTSLAFVSEQLPRSLEQPPAMSSNMVLSELVAVSFCICELVLRALASPRWISLVTDMYFVISAATIVPLIIFLVRQCYCTLACKNSAKPLELMRLLQVRAVYYTLAAPWHLL